MGIENLFTDLVPSRTKTTALKILATPQDMEQQLNALYYEWYTLRYALGGIKHRQAVFLDIYAPTVKATKGKVASEKSNVLAIKSDLGQMTSQIEAKVQQECKRIKRKIGRIRNNITQVLEQYINSDYFSVKMRIFLKKGAKEGTMRFLDLVPTDRDLDDADDVSLVLSNTAMSRAALYWIFNNRLSPINPSIVYESPKQITDKIKKQIPDISIDMFGDYFPSIGRIRGFDGVNYNFFGIPILCKAESKYFVIVISPKLNHKFSDRLTLKGYTRDYGTCGNLVYSYELDFRDSTDMESPHLFFVNRYEKMLSKESIVQINSHILATFAAKGIFEKLSVGSDDYLVKKRWNV